MEQISQNPYLNHLIGPNFEELNQLLAVSFENAVDGTTHKRNYFSKPEIKEAIS